jgi:hypothetical protein
MTPLRALSTESYQFSVKIAQIYDYSYVRFRSLADLLTDSSLMSASEGKADVPSWSIL